MFTAAAIAAEMNVVGTAAEEVATNEVWDSAQTAATTEEDDCMSIVSADWYSEADSATEEVAPTDLEEVPMSRDLAVNVCACAYNSLCRFKRSANPKGFYTPEAFQEADSDLKKAEDLAAPYLQGELEPYSVDKSWKDSLLEMRKELNDILASGNVSIA